MKLILGKHGAKDVIFDSKNGESSSAVVLGSTGTRKSTTLHDVGLQIVEQGGTVLAFDALNVLGSDYVFYKLQERFEKVMVNHNVHETGIMINLFQPLRYSDGSLESTEEIVDSIGEILSSTYNLGCAQAAVLKDALRILSKRQDFDEEGIQSLKGILTDLEDPKAVDVCRKISSLMKYNLLQPGELRIEKGKFNIFRMSKFPFQTQKILTELALKLIWRYAVNGAYRENPIFIFIDEFHENVVTKSKGVLATLLTQGRRYGVNLLLCSQVLPKDREFCSILLQSALWMVFGPSTADVTRISRMIEPAHPYKWLDVLSNLEPGHFITVGPVKVGERITTKNPLHVEARSNKI